MADNGENIAVLIPHLLHFLELFQVVVGKKIFVGERTVESLLHRGEQVHEAPAQFLERGDLLLGWPDSLQSLGYFKEQPLIIMAFEVLERDAQLRKGQGVFFRAGFSAFNFRGLLRERVERLGGVVGGESAFLEYVVEALVGLFVHVQPGGANRYAVGFFDEGCQLFLD